MSQPSLVKIRLITTRARSGLGRDVALYAYRGKTETTVAATEVTAPDERNRLWDIACPGFPPYRELQERSGRLFPIFTLEATET